MSLPRVGVEAVFDTSNFDTGLRRYNAGLGQADAAAQKFAGNQNAAFGQVARGMAGLAAGAGLEGLAVASVMVAARSQELGAVLSVVGQRAGYTTQQWEGYVKGLEEINITTEQAKQTALRFIQAGLDLADMNKLGRVAQDAAVVGMVDSSTALERMTYAIASQQSEMLRTLGLTVDWEGAYKRFAEQTNRTSKDLTAQEKTTIRLNTTLEAGAAIQGAYTAAMETSGKQLRSMARLTEEAKLAMGQGLLPAMDLGVKGATALLKAFNALPPEMQGAIGAAVGLGGAIVILGTAISILAPGIAMARGAIEAMTVAKVGDTGASLAHAAAVTEENAAMVGTSGAASTAGNALGGLAKILAGLALAGAAVAGLNEIRVQVQASKETDTLLAQLKELQNTKLTSNPFENFFRGTDAQINAITEALKRRDVLAASSGETERDAIDAALSKLREQTAEEDRATQGKQVAAAAAALRARGEDITTAAIQTEIPQIQALAAAEAQLAAIRISGDQAKAASKEIGAELSFIQISQATKTQDLNRQLREAERASRGVGSSQSGMQAQVRAANDALSKAQARVAALSDELNSAKDSVNDYMDSWFIGEKALRLAILDARQRAIELELAEGGALKAAGDATSASVEKFDMLAAQQRELREGVPVYVSLLEWQKRQEEAAAKSKENGSKKEDISDADRAKAALHQLELRQQLLDLQRDRLKLISDESTKEERTFDQAKAGLLDEMGHAKGLTGQLADANAQLKVQQQLVDSLNRLQQTMSDLLSGQGAAATAIKNRIQDIIDKEADRAAGLKIIDDILKQQGQPRFAELMRSAGAEVEAATGKVKILGLEVNALAKEPMKFDLDPANAYKTLQEIDTRRRELAKDGITLKLDANTAVFEQTMRFARTAQMIRALVIGVNADTTPADTTVATFRLATSEPINTTVTVTPPPPVEVEVLANTESFTRSIAQMWANLGVSGNVAGGGGIGSRQSGGMVPGPVGAPQLAIVHGGERVISPLGGGGTVTNNNTYNFSPTVNAGRGEDSVAAWRREALMARMTGRGIGW